MYKNTNFAERLRPAASVDIQKSNQTIKPEQFTML